MSPPTIRLQKFVYENSHVEICLEKVCLPLTELETCIKKYFCKEKSNNNLQKLSRYLPEKDLHTKICLPKNLPANVATFK